MFGGLFTFLATAVGAPAAAPAPAEAPAVAAASIEELRRPKKQWLAAEHDIAICLCAGHIDLVSAISLTCTKQRLHQVLSPWLRGLRSGQLQPHEPVCRLWVAADAVRKLENLTELRIGGSRLDARWLRGAVTGHALVARNVLDLRGAMSSTSLVLISFALTTVACHACRHSAVSRVVLPGGTAVDLRGRTLDVSKRSLGDEGASGVAGVLAGALMPQLRDLHLSLNKLTDLAMHSLGAAIESGALVALRVLRLSENRIGPAGARAFAISTKAERLPALTTLSFDGNQIGDAGVRALAESLSRGGLPALEELGLVRNGLTDVTPLVEAIAGGELPMLRRLLLQHNQLGEGSLRGLHDTVEASKPKPGVRDPRSPTKLAPHDHDADAEGVAVRVRGLYRESKEDAHVRMNLLTGPSMPARVIRRTRPGAGVEASA